MKTKYYIPIIAVAILAASYLFYERTFINIVGIDHESKTVEYEAGYKGMRVCGTYNVREKQVYNSCLLYTSPSPRDS